MLVVDLLNNLFSTFKGNSLVILAVSVSNWLSPKYQWIYPLITNPAGLVGTRSIWKHLPLSWTGFVEFMPQKSNKLKFLVIWTPDSHIIVGVHFTTSFDLLKFEIFFNELPFTMHAQTLMPFLHICNRFILLLIYSLFIDQCIQIFGNFGNLRLSARNSVEQKFEIAICNTWITT